MSAILILALASSSAVADDGGLGYSVCTKDLRHAGAKIDLSVKDADIHDVLRLLADRLKINIVVPDDVTGKVTLHVRRVPLYQILCTIADMHHLDVVSMRSILRVSKRSPKSSRPSGA
jgi:type II secretory pathway component HofQ